MAKVFAQLMANRKKCGDHGGAQDNFPMILLLEETPYAYGVLTRGSPVEDGT
jgi:hypothetical protein